MSTGLVANPVAVQAIHWCTPKTEECFVDYMMCDQFSSKVERFGRLQVYRLDPALGSRDLYDVFVIEVIKLQPIYAREDILNACGRASRLVLSSPQISRLKNTLSLIFSPFCQPRRPIT
jgi:hypothetical protein